MNSRFILGATLVLGTISATANAELCRDARKIHKALEKKPQQAWRYNEVLQVTDAYRECLNQNSKKAGSKPYKTVQKRVMRLLVPHILEKDKAGFQGKYGPDYQFQSTADYNRCSAELSKLVERVKTYDACLSGLDPDNFKPKKGEEDLMDCVRSFHDLKTWCNRRHQELRPAWSAKKDRYDELVEKSENSKQDRRWTEAIRLLDQALAILPGETEEINAQKDRMINERNRYYKDEIAARRTKFDDAEKTNDRLAYTRGAISLLNAFKVEQPLPEASLVDDSRNAALTMTMEMRNLHRDEKKYYTAYSLMKDAGLIDDSSNQPVPKWIEDGYKHYSDLAQQAQQDEEYCYAYIAAAKAEKMKHESQGHIPVSDLDGNLDKLIQIRIIIDDFQVPPSESGPGATTPYADAGRDFTDRLRAYLYQHLPYGLVIEEPEKKAWLANENLEECKNILGLDYIVYGTVSVNIDAKVKINPKQKSVTIIETVQNAYTYDMLKRALKEHGKSKFGDNLPSRTVTQPMSPPPTISFKERAASIEGAMVVSLQIYPSEEDDKTKIESKKGLKTDIFQERLPVDPNTAVNALGPAHSITLPAKVVVLDQLEEDAVKKAADWLLLADHFGHRQKRFQDMAVDQISKGDTYRAVQAAAQGYYYCLKHKVPEDDPYFVALREMAFDLTE